MAVLLALALLCARFETPISSLQHSRGQHRAQVASCKALPDRKRHLACVDAVDFKFSSLMYLNYEPVLRRLVRDLLHDCCLIGNGSIVDAGAHTGSESALYAASRPSSIVHAVEPMVQNIKVLRRMRERVPNLVPLHGALGAADGAGTYVVNALEAWQRRYGGQLIDVNSSHSVGSPRLPPNGSAIRFPIFAVDGLLAGRWRGEKLAFLHLDVEGDELVVLRGAREAIRTSSPWLTV